MNQAVVSAIPTNVMIGGLVGLYLPIAFFQAAFDETLKPGPGAEDNGWDKREENIFLTAYWWTLENVQEITMSKWSAFTLMFDHLAGMLGIETEGYRVKDYDFYNMNSTDFILKLFGSLFLWLIWLALDIAAFSIVAPYYAVWYTFNNWTSWADMAVARHAED